MPNTAVPTWAVLALYALLIGGASYAGGRLADWWAGRPERRRRAHLRRPTPFESTPHRPRAAR